MVTQPKNAADEYLTLEDGALIAQCNVDHYRSRGPGGQKRNKTSSAVRLRHRPTDLAVTATEERSQHVNTVRAIRRLREAIALDIRSEIDVERYQRSELLSSCIAGDGQLCVGRRDRRYYPAVCEILDLMAACTARVRDAARCAGVSTANLVKFIRNDPKLWRRVNQMRAEAGIKPLR
ncbi:MAG: peptide chain release factor-like protein [Phycisphaerae bacterium]